ncbi:hypothetical protein T492DRAFT_377449 [Pavlovales sp. CCMP2436]|nr:hypothetical protein T492DRAFT_377449 [Pavlovales sp. CCMP2436]
MMIMIILIMIITIIIIIIIIAIVGYGTTAAGTDYWIIKNSWSAAWGEGGYLRLHRGSNACGISNAASYPLV